MEEWFLIQNGYVVYLSLFLLLMGGAIGLPIPEDLPLVLAGVMAFRGNGQIEILFAVSYVAIILGDLFIYAIGRKFGNALFNKEWFQKRVPKYRIRFIKRSLEKRGLLMVFIARHLFYLRTVTFLICGAVNVKFKKFLIADMLAALVSAPLMIGLGYLGAEHYDSIAHSTGKAEIIAITIGITALVIFLMIYLKKKLITDEELLEDGES